MRITEDFCQKIAENSMRFAVYGKTPHCWVLEVQKKLSFE